jgi:DNA-binding MarR family transcriptional regulator
MYSIRMSGPTAGFLVWRLSMQWKTAVDRALAPLGLTHAQYSLLATLYGLQHDERRMELPSQRRLADHTGLEALYVSKLARTLEAAGLIDRLPDPADTRAVQLRITPRGREVGGQAVVIVRELMARLLAPLDEDRRAAFVADLHTLLDNE